MKKVDFHQSLPTNVYFKIMPEKFDKKFNGNRYYNFLVVFFGLFFAAHIIMPDEWQKPTQFILAVFISAAIAKFATSNRNQN